MGLFRTILVYPMGWTASVAYD